MPYYIGALVAAAAMAWYFFAFVPAKRDYFIGLRFRTLAVASQHISSKLENLALAFRGPMPLVCPTKPSDTPTIIATTKYLSLVVPAIRMVGNHPPIAEPSLAGCDANLNGAIPWDDVVAQASTSSLRDFDDLILATAKGDVVWQRETTTPRIANLSELLGAVEDTEGWGLSWREKATRPVKKELKNLAGTAQLKSVNVGGNPSLLLVQAVPVRGSAKLPEASDPSDPKLYVAGLVAREGLMRQARRIPAAWLVPFGCAILFLFLAIPFIKLGTLTAKERFRFTDVLLMIVATVLAAGVGTLLPFVSGSATTADRALHRFANQLESNFAREARTIMALGNHIHSNTTRVATGLERCAVSVAGLIETGDPKQTPPGPANCGLWQALDRSWQKKDIPGIDPKAPPIELDVVIWVASSGSQVKKWTTKSQVTGGTSHAGFEHFRALHSDHLWTLEADPKADPEAGAKTITRFTVEPLRAPTTSELAVAFAMPAKNDTIKSDYLILNVRPQSLVEPLVPPGYGFAVVAPDGKVLFHSEEGLSLEENFFEELGDAREARSSVAERRVLQWSGDYHGRRHRLRMQPITRIVGCPWSIVTFEESEPRLSAEVSEQSGIFRLGMVNLGALALIAGIFAAHSRRKHRRSRELMQMLLADSRSAKKRVKWLSSVALIELLLLASTFRGWAVSLDVVYGFLVTLPLAALLVTFLVRRWAEDGTQLSSDSTKAKPQRHWTKSAILGSELGLVMVVVGVLPAAGFSQIVRIVHSTNETERWLQVAQDQWAARQRRLDERLHSPNYAADTTARLQKGFGAAVFDVETSPRTYSYLTALPSVQAGAALQPPSGDGLVRWVLGWNLFSSKATPAAWPPYGETRPTSGPISALTVVQSREWAATSGPLVLAGAGILIFAVWAIYWARHKLLAHPTPAASLEIAVAGVGQATDAVLLLIGPPMTKKDDELLRVVRDTKAGVVAERIRLLYAKLTPEWVEAEATRVDQAVKLLIPKNEKSTPFWIHVSNLEAQLVDAGARYLVFDLLQRLGSSTAGERRVVAVTSSVDPIAHFEEIFDDERKRIYRDPVPEVALSRSALLLSKVRRCYMPISKPEDRLKRCRHAWDQWWSYDPYKWRETLKAELAGLAPLKPIHDELLALWEARATQSPDDAVPFEEIVETIRLRAAAYYQLLWTICTRSEKLVLIQLAQEGFVVEQSWDVVAPLIAKGIVVERPIPAIFNRTFRDFLLDIERDAVIQEWERGDGHGLWLVSSRLIGSSLVAGLLFFLLTQDVSVQSLLPVVSGTGVFSVPLVRSLIARFSPKSAGSTA